jgi:hypothetical protein
MPVFQFDLDAYYAGRGGQPRLVYHCQRRTSPAADRKDSRPQSKQRTFNFRNLLETMMILVTSHALTR